MADRIEAIAEAIFRARNPGAVNVPWDTIVNDYLKEEYRRDARAAEAVLASREEPLREQFERSKRDWAINEEALMNACDCIRGFNFLFDGEGNLKEHYQDQLSVTLEKAKLFPNDWKIDAAMKLKARPGSILAEAALASPFHPKTEPSSNYVSEVRLGATMKCQSCGSQQWPQCPTCGAMMVAKYSLPNVLRIAQKYVHAPEQRLQDFLNRALDTIWNRLENGEPAQPLAGRDEAERARINEVAAASDRLPMPSVSTQPDIPELKPCPFCGSKNIDAEGWAGKRNGEDDGELVYGPACDDCGAAAGEVGKTTEENIAAWNTRSLEARLETQLAEHFKHVQQFLTDMYATMIDPVEASGLKVAELCALLLKQATEDRQRLYDLQAENARLKAPVSDEEWTKWPSIAGTRMAYRADVDALLSQRERSK
jgi:Lar family restriction alleviation protein